MSTFLFNLVSLLNVLRFATLQVFVTKSDKSVQFLGRTFTGQP